MFTVEFPSPWGHTDKKILTDSENIKEYVNFIPYMKTSVAKFFSSNFKSVFFNIYKDFEVRTIISMKLHTKKFDIDLMSTDLKGYSRERD